MKRIQPHDKAGREIKPGDLIVYSGAVGRSAILQYGKVLDVRFKVSREKVPGGWDWQEVEVPRYYVQGVWEWEGVANLNQKGTLQFNDRILVLYRDQLPKIVLDALDAVSVPAPKSE